MKKQISVGVIGCGYWGPLLVRNFKSLPDCQLKAVCDLSTERLKHVRALYPDIEGMTQTQQLLNGTNVDAVVIAAPVKHHFPLAKAALLAGKHTFIEKPMASSSAECEELIEIADRNGSGFDDRSHFSLLVAGAEDCPNRSSRRSGRNPLYQLPASQSGIVPKGHQCRVGSGSTRYLDHSPYSWTNCPLQLTARETLILRREWRT